MENRRIIFHCKRKTVRNKRSMSSQDTNNDTRSNTMRASGTVILYDGPLVLWRKNNEHLDLVIALHPTQQCMEVACYNPVLDVESPRLYLDWQRFSEDVDKQRVEEKVGVAKEQWLRHVKIGEFDAEQVRKDVVTELMLKFILARLDTGGTEEDENNIERDGHVSASFSMVLTPQMGDSIVQQTYLGQQEKVLNAILADAPAGIVPIALAHHRSMNSYQVGTTLNRLQREAEDAHNATHLAELATSSTDGFRLMMEERMRLQSRHSLARLRWIYAIRRIITLQTVAKVRQRVMKSKLAVWYKETKLNAKANAATNILALKKESDGGLIQTLLYGSHGKTAKQLAVSHKHALLTNKRIMEARANLDNHSPAHGRRHHRHYLKQNMHRHSQYTDLLHQERDLLINPDRDDHITQTLPSIPESPFAVNTRPPTTSGLQLGKDIGLPQLKISCATSEDKNSPSSTSPMHRFADEGKSSSQHSDCYETEDARTRGRRLVVKSHHHHSHIIFALEPHHVRRRQKLHLLENEYAIDPVHASGHKMSPTSGAVDVKRHRQRVSSPKLSPTAKCSGHNRPKSSQHHGSPTHNDAAVRMPNFIARATSKHIVEEEEKLQESVEVHIQHAFIGSPTNVVRSLRAQSTQNVNLQSCQSTPTLLNVLEAVTSRQ